MDKKLGHENFVQNLTGSSSGVVAATFADIGLLLFYHDLGWIWLNGNLNKFPGSAKWKYIFDFFTIVVPALLIVTILSDHISFITLLLSIPFLIISVISLLRGEAEDLHTDGAKQLQSWFKLLRSSLPENFLRSIVSRFRGILILFTSIVILAVDFRIFPRWMAKTETEGFSVMDAGVGAFVVAGALVGPQSKELTTSSKKLVIRDLQDSVVLLVLGFGRSLSVALLNYQSPEAEYGKHWNFFCTLAVIKVFGRLATVALHPKYLPVLGSGILVLYEIALQNGLYLWTISPLDQSSDNIAIKFFLDNRSGIFSCIGFIGMTLIWTFVGREFALSTRVSTTELILFIVELTFVSLFCYIATWFLPIPSRRVTNASYVLWISYLSLGFLALTSTIKLFLEAGTFQYLIFNMARHSDNRDLTSESINARSVICIMETMNFNALPLFLIANLLTGFINMSVDTISCSASTGLIILIVYSAAVSGISFILCYNGIRIPLKFNGFFDRIRVVKPANERL